ncbi:hypothetical protein [Leptolyngbya sp. PL-A3]|uniref:hypothetical protein n=1 Tax=Leptolyngbya sp. PL-A3 TaxID=2933911 RepID=UPI003299814E
MKARDTTRDYYLKRQSEHKLSKNGGTATKDVKEDLQKRGITDQIHELSKRLNQIGLDEISRFLLSSPDIYAVLIYDAIEKAEIDPKKDVTGLCNSVLRAVQGDCRKYFLARLLTTALDERRLQVKPNDPRWQKLDDLVLSQGLPIQQDKFDSAISDVLGTIYQKGDIHYYLNAYIRGDINNGIKKRTVLPEESFTSAIEQGMTDYLVNLGIKFKSKDAFTSGEYDEYFVLAYHDALKRSTVKDDPIDQFRLKGQVDWDFTVDSFDQFDQVDVQGVIPTNIKAAGALDYVYVVGELMHVFDVANALVLRWARGILDVPNGKTASDLYRFHKLRNERSTYEERAMLYKRVLNKGDGQLLSKMVANRAFSRLWHKLMVEVTEYIRKSEGKQMDVTYLSKAQVFQATKNLQYNLTENMTGMAHVQVAEDYAHLQEALAILKADEILNMFGGRRKTIWSVIERVAREDLGMIVPTAPLKTLAVESNKIYQWIANFNEGIVQDSGFNTFLSAAESWIIAQASIDTEELETEETELGIENGSGAESDDFDDWEV